MCVSTAMSCGAAWWYWWTLENKVHYLLVPRTMHIRQRSGYIRYLCEYTMSIACRSWWKCGTVIVRLCHNTEVKSNIANDWYSLVGLPRVCSLLGSYNAVSHPVIYKIFRHIFGMDLHAIWVNMRILKPKQDGHRLFFFKDSKRTPGNEN